MSSPSRWNAFIGVLPWVILFTSLLLTFLYWNGARYQLAAKAESDFESLFSRVTGALEDRIKANEQILRAAVGLFNSSTHVTRQEFKTFVAALHLDIRYPGIQGVGFAELISPPGLDSHLQALRKEGFPDYEIRPSGTRDVYTSIIYLEPFDWRNQRAFGYDMFSEPVRRAAMLRAQDSGSAAMSGKVTLLQEIKTDVQAGFLLYMPIFRQGEHHTAEERRLNLLGWAYSPIRMGDMMQSMFSRDLVGIPTLMRVTIHDGDRPSPQSLMFESLPVDGVRPDAITRTRTIEVAGNKWTVSARSTPAFSATLEKQRQNIILATGLLISLLLFILTRGFTSSHLKVANALAQTAAANRELNASQEELRKNALELERHRNHLEEMVAEQTEALIETNTELARAKEAAEASNRAKDAFLANISHEIRTPLNSISGMSFLIRRDLQDPKQEERLQKIDTAVQQLIDIINDVLEISRIEAGQFALDEASVHVPMLLDGVLGFMSGRAAGKGIRLFKESDNLPINLLGDTRRLRQALINYASNALKFTEQGSITVRVSKLQETIDDVLLKFEVIDTGIGIEAEAIDRLFSAFEQGDNSTTRKYGGTGLGLAITHRLAKLMGGETGATSRPGHGSTFWFSARLKKTCVESEQTRVLDERYAEVTLMRDFAGSRILLAEDDEINREVVAGLLQQVLLDVDTVADGLEAVELAGSGDYALILSDLLMPNMGGIETATLIRQLPGKLDIPIIALTANVTDISREECRAAGLNDFIPKPVEPKELYATVLKWLAHPETSDAI